MRLQIDESCRHGHYNLWKTNVLGARVCIACRRQSVKKYVLNNRERHLEQQRAGQKRYAEKYPEKVKAQQAANNRRWRLLKQKCEHCDSTETLHLHHPDYSKPLFVMTLCFDCHEKTHHGEIHA